MDTGSARTARTAAASAASSAVPGGWQAVTAHGAKGDGAADDAPAVQAALNWARDNGGGWIVVPPGVYLLATLPLRIYRDTRLTLMPGAEFRRGTAATMLLNGDAGQDHPAYTGHSRITVEGGVWDMRGTTAGLTGSAMCVSLGHATDIAVRDLEIRDLPGFHAIELNAVRRASVRDCAFLGYTDPGGRDFSEALQLDLAKSPEVFGGFGPYDHTPCEDVLVEGCHFGASGTPGTTAWPRGIGSHSATIGRYHRRIRLLGNTFEGVLQYGVSAYNWEDVTITGNTFTECGSGVRVRSVISADTDDTRLPDGTATGASQPVRNITVTGNTFRSGGAHDEPVVALGEPTGQIRSLVVSGNVVDGSAGAQHGIRLEQVASYTVTGNIISDVAGHAVGQDTCTGGTVSGNQISGPGGCGITATGCTHTGILGNTVLDAGASGIHLQGGTGLRVRDNHIAAPGRASGAGSPAYGIRISTSATSLSLSGNTTSAGSGGPRMANSLSVSGTCSGIRRYGNDWRGAAVDDRSASPRTSAADLTG